MSGRAATSFSKKTHAIWVVQIARMLEARGHPSDPVLRKLGLDPKRLQQAEAEIDFAQEVDMFEAAAIHLGDPCFGLHFGASADPLDAGLIGYVAASAATLGDAFRMIEKYIGVSSEGVREKLEIQDQLAVLSEEIVDPSARQYQQTVEFSLALITNFSRFVAQNRLTPEWTEFRHARRDHVDEFERFFGAPVHFGRRRNAIALNRSLLELPCHSADERLLGILKGYCEQILKQRRQELDLRRQVEHLVARLLPTGSVRIMSIAKELGMSERTLARRLQALETSFGQIVDEVRRKLAFRYLEDSNARTSQIAYMLGYSEPSAFNHAFRRWTGVTPTQYKRGRR
ncbi:MAG: AraC family transcriptional regulator [Alphaproteobacteria bacterium]|nr:AraC family transcriptional regulator [Alphaproteobacteria bacterium]